MLFRNRQRGAGALILTVLLAMVPLGLFALQRYGELSHRASREMRSELTRTRLSALRVALTDLASDVDADGEKEPLVEGPSNAVPAAVAIDGTDGWGHAIRYCTWDPGAANGSDPAYSVNNVAPPRTDLTGRLISAGPNGTFETACTDADTTGDDLVAEFSKTSTVNLGGGSSGAWVDGGSSVTLATAADTVSIGTDTPVEKLTVNGAVTIGDASDNVAGTLRYRQGNFEGFNGTRWKNLAGRYPPDNTLDGDVAYCTAAGRQSSLSPKPTSTITISEPGTYLVYLRTQNYYVSTSTQVMHILIKVNGTTNADMLSTINQNHTGGQWQTEISRGAQLDLSAGQVVTVELLTGASSFHLRCWQAHAIRLF